MATATFDGPRPPSIARQGYRRLRAGLRRRVPLAWRAGRHSKPLNLALQGGGAHGAFTWGVLDALLADGRVRFDGLSGTSAGAVNAVLLAAGLAEGGPDAARERLHDFWTSLATVLAPPLLDLATRFFSPYELNPLDVNPLRRRLEALVDFERLRTVSSLRLFVGATDVATGKRRIFRGDELSVDVVLASSCLPHLH